MKKPNFKRVLNNLKQNGEGMQHYRVAVPSDELAIPVANAIANSKPASLSVPIADFRSPVSASTFDILITRATAAIAQVLPVPLFGVLDNESDWIEIMNQFLQSGTTYTVARNADRKSLNFVFTAGLDSDTITVSCNQVPYVNFLIAGLDSVFKLQQIKMQISDVAEQSQFSRAIHIYNRSMFGADLNDSITPNQYKSDLQNQNDIRTINQIISIDKERSLLVLVNAAAALVITFSMFVEKYDKGQSAINF